MNGACLNGNSSLARLGHSVSQSGPLPRFLFPLDSFAYLIDGKRARVSKNVHFRCLTLGGLKLNFRFSLSASSVSHTTQVFFNKLKIRLMPRSQSLDLWKYVWGKMPSSGLFEAASVNFLKYRSLDRLIN